MDAVLTVFLVGLGMAFAAALVVFVLVYPPMRRMLGVNSALRAARSFYGRTFFIVMLLAAWAPILESLDVPAAESAEEGAEAAVAAPEKTPAFMETVWDVAGDLEDVCLSVGIFLLAYVVVLTIVYAALGRIRDPEDV
ncbi:MAG: hypothetical protein AMS14_00725 [Planctomycetes bacterium DG_20]|nr:MAG: hypothetical protein AMS14_00725 [Planctomycetes bacterium DG_20]